MTAHSAHAKCADSISLKNRISFENASEYANPYRRWANFHQSALFIRIILETCFAFSPPAPAIIESRTYFVMSLKSVCFIAEKFQNSDLADSIL